MNYVNYRISLDMFDTSSQITLKAKKGDSACRIIIALTKNGKMYDIKEGCKAELIGKNSNGNAVHFDCNVDAEKDIIECDFAESIDKDTGVCKISAVEGVVECEVILCKDSKQLTSPRFNLIIDGTVCNGGESEFEPQSETLRKLITEANATIEELNDYSYVPSEADKTEIANIVLKEFVDGDEVSY
jgi:hypothetical protein